MKSQRLRVGIVGAGRMGRIRAFSAKAHPQSDVVAIVDSIVERARSLAAELCCQAGTDWQELLEREDIDAIVVSTPHKFLAPITTAALNSEKYVFCEKPGARNVAEAEAVLRAYYGNWNPNEGNSGTHLVPQGNSRLVVGFTLRHYPAIVRAGELINAGAIGQPMYVRARYGHGGRPDYDLEWRGDPEMAGWIAYSGTRANWQNEKFKQEFPKEPTYRRTLKEEAEALDTMVTVLAPEAASQKKAEKLDPALLALIHIDHEGLLEAARRREEAVEHGARRWPGDLA